MATRAADIHDVGESRHVERVQVRNNVTETKASFMTTEFWAMVAVIAAVLYAARELGHFTGQEAWTLVSVVAVGYMVSRGLAKAGSGHRDDS